MASTPPRNSSAGWKNLSKTFCASCKPSVNTAERSSLDSLGKRLNNPLPRLSRLERFYGKRETGPRLRNARHVDSESAPTRSAARTRDRRSDSADVERDFARRARFALSGALSIRSAG